MKIAVTGASGLIGSALLPRLKSEGHQVIRLVRRAPQQGQVLWNPETGEIDTKSLEGVEAVIHLAGETIAGLRFTKAKKRCILESRKKGTGLLAKTLASLQHPPKVLVCASAIGYYGNRGSEPLTEESHVGTGFLAEVVEAWESAAQPARDGGIRVVNLRIGIILSKEGSALKSLLPLYRMGLGGRVGSGKQYWSWVSLDDVISSFLFALRNESLRGPVNVTAPHPVTYREFSKTLGRVLRRPAFLWTPALALKLLMGELADELLLASSNVAPSKLLANGFSFKHVALEPSLRDILSRPRKG